MIVYSCLKCFYAGLMLMFNNQNELAFQFAYYDGGLLTMIMAALAFHIHSRLVSKRPRPIACLCGQ
jgi:hypothetical protein